ncbi:MAG: T9SS C-terminal target domain-containing protein [Calditrichaeota bacterium]|nr:MAG: T9SS C-terminal target domain-containing protein [Calditrichota bacterium]MBL1205589.1 T9SS C-terminal target domain-containing protein [Calditrichota bacterium]
MPDPRTADEPDLDFIAPSSVSEFSVSLINSDGSSVAASWDNTSSGDDSTSGSISSFEIRWASKEAGLIDNDEKWSAATIAFQGNSTVFADGSTDIDMSSFNIGDKYFAIRTSDEAGNISQLENGSFSDLISVPDAISPASVSNFLVTEVNSDFSLATASWDNSSSGDDSTSGSISSFEIRWANDEKVNTNAKWETATVVFQGDSSDFAKGSVQIDMSGTTDDSKYFAIRTKDEADNISPLETGSYTDIVSDIKQFKQPKSFQLNQNYPNPFGEKSAQAKEAVTTIKYKLSKPSHVSLDIYNTLGQKIQTLVDMDQVNGDYSIKFDASGLPGGIYIYRIKAGSKILTKKMLLLR